MPAGAPTRLPGYLQLGQDAQSQHVHCAHPHSPVLQQSQHAAAEAAVTRVVNGADAMAMTAEAMSSNDLINKSPFKD